MMDEVHDTVTVSRTMGIYLYLFYEGLDPPYESNFTESFRVNDAVQKWVGISDPMHVSRFDLLSQELGSEKV
jgi:hypothetical protein